MIEKFLIEMLGRICGMVSAIIYNNGFSNKLSDKECYALLSCADEFYNILLNKFDCNTLEFIKNEIDNLFDELNSRGDL